MKRLLMFALAALLVCGAALAEVKKEEVVYALVNSGGEVMEASVVNLFEADGKTAVRDYGDYSEAVDLTGLNGLAYQNGEIAFTMERGRYSYEGRLKTAVLPWRIAVRYQLDGKEISPEELSGKSGRLAIMLSVTPDEALSEYTRSMALQISLTLDGDRALQISAPKATVAVNGGKRVLSYVVLAGLSADYTVTAQVNDFYMDRVSCAGVRMAMDPEMYKKAAQESLKDSPFLGVASNVIDSFMGREAPPPRSFASEKNGEVTAVQFVILVEGVEKAARPAPETAPEQEKSGLIDRVRVMFGL